MPILPQLVLLLFLTAIVIVAYEMRSALKPPACAECAHCRALQVAADERAAEVQDWYARRYGMHRPDDKDRHG